MLDLRGVTQMETPTAIPNFTIEGRSPPGLWGLGWSWAWFLRAQKKEPARGGLDEDQFLGSCVSK